MIKKRKLRESKVFPRVKNKSSHGMKRLTSDNEKNIVASFSDEIKKIQIEFFKHEIKKYKDIRLTILD